MPDDIKTPQSIAQLIMPTQDPSAPNVGMAQSPSPIVPQNQIPQLAGSPGSSAASKPPKPGLPTIFQALVDMVHPPQVASAPGQLARPVSRLDIFENALGNFMQAFGAGLANSGHGPGANARGAGAAIQAPYQNAITQWQLGQEQQKNDSENQLKQAQTSSLNSGQYVPTPNGMVWVPNKDAGKVVSSEVGAGARERVADINAASRESVAGQNNATRKDIADQSNKTKLEQFRETQKYKIWKEKLDVDTRTKVASLSQNKAPAAMMQTATFAQSGINRLDDAAEAFSDLKNRGVLGSVSADKMYDWVFGKGLIDPSLPPKDRQQISRLRAALSYTSSAAMRAHTGRTSREIYDDFKTTMSLGQGADALEGAMGETRSMLTDYAASASDESIKTLRSGGNSRIPPAKSSVSAEDLLKMFPPKR